MPELGQLLVARGSFDPELWRRFHCNCCRRVWEYIADEKARHAIEIAERFSQGDRSKEELALEHEQMAEATDLAWQNVNAQRLASDDYEAVWPISAEADQAWAAYLGAGCAKVVTQDVIKASTIPEEASSLLAWSTARKQEVANRGRSEGIVLREAVERTWKQIRDAEENEQAHLLQTLVAEWEKGT